MCLLSHYRKFDMFNKIKANLVKIFSTDNKKEVIEETPNSEVLVETTKEGEIKTILSIDLSISEIINKRIYQVKNNNGWCLIDIDKHLDETTTNIIIKAFKETELEWSEKFPLIWFRNIRFFTVSEMFLINLNFKNHLKEHKEEELLLFKRLLTISSILFKFEIPISLVQLDKYTIELLYKYIIMTECFTIDSKNTLPGTDKEFIQINNFDKCIVRVLNNPFFTNIFGNYQHYRHRHQNILVLYEGVIATEREMSLLKNLSILQFRKIMTAIFLMNQIEIPKDYIYIDMQVLDYVNNEL